MGRKPFSMPGRLSLVFILAGAIAAPALGQGTLFVEGDNVGIGVETPADRLHVLGDEAISARFEQGTLIVERTDDAIANIRFASTGGGGQSWLFQNNPNAEVFAVRDETFNVSPFRIYRDGTANTFVVRNGRWGLQILNPGHPIHTNANGAHLNSAGQWVDGSSRVHKRDVEGLSLEEAMVALNALNPVKWASVYEEDGPHRVGFIAEDVPELVAQRDRDGVSAVEIVGVLTRVVQEQQAELAELKARLARVEGERSE